MGPAVPEQNTAAIAWAVKFSIFHLSLLLFIKHMVLRLKTDLSRNTITSGKERQKKKVDIIESYERYTEILQKLTHEWMPQCNISLHWYVLLLRELCRYQLIEESGSDLQCFPRQQGSQPAPHCRKENVNISLFYPQTLLTATLLTWLNGAYASCASTAQAGWNSVIPTWHCNCYMGEATTKTGPIVGMTNPCR